MDHTNPEYEAWEVQDQTLLVWLQLTLSKSVLSCVLGSNHSYQVWEKIHEHFSLHTKSRARQLQTAMRAVSLEGKTMDEYLHKIKNYVDELASVGVPVRHEEHVDAILEGLPSDYAPVVSVIESKKHMPSIAEIEALLYGHETRLVRYNHDTQMLVSPLLITLKAIHMEVSSKLMIPVVLEEVMAEVMVAAIHCLIEVVVAVVLEEAAVEVGLLTSSVKSASSMVTLLMCATFVLI